MRERLLPEEAVLYRTPPDRGRISSRT